MADEILPFEIATNKSSIIKVLGVGGGGSNAVNHMFKQGIEGVDFMICNTDAQALAKSNVPVRLQLGITLTEGLGAGNRPERGREAAIESMEDIKKQLGNNTKMMFITAGMGGGTGTGAAPVIAQIAKELDILTIGIVTIPFRFEGRRRINQAIEGITEMGKYVDSLLIVNNEKIREIYGNLGQKEAFGKADDVLTIGAKSIAEIITKEGHVNVDFADVKTVMAESGVALMGAGEAEGEERALKAIEGALNSPLLNNNDIGGATNILLNITSGTSEVTMDEIGFINDYVQERTGFSADLIWGSSEDKDLGEKVAITIIATGFNASDIPEVYTSPSHDPSITRKIKRTNLPTDFHKEVPIEVEDKTKETEKKPEPKYNTPNIDGEIKLVSADNNKKSEDPVFKTPNQLKKEFSDIQLNEDGLAEIKARLAENTARITSSANYIQNIDKNEEEPAYKRYGVSLDLDRKIDADKISRFMLTGSGSDTKLNENNRYLHDNVD